MFHVKPKIKCTVDLNERQLSEKRRIYTRYIGESERSLKDRVCEHLGYINTHRIDQPAGKHFNMRGHSKADMRVVILERVFKQDPAY